MSNSANHTPGHISPARPIYSSVTNPTGSLWVPHDPSSHRQPKTPPRPSPIRCPFSVRHQMTFAVSCGLPLESWWVADRWLRALTSCRLGVIGSAVWVSGLLCGCRCWCGGPVFMPFVPGQPGLRGSVRRRRGLHLTGTVAALVVVGVDERRYLTVAGLGFGAEMPAGVSHSERPAYDRLMPQRTVDGIMSDKRRVFA